MKYRNWYGRFDHKIDIRGDIMNKSERTKQILGQALKDLVSKKPLDKINIKEITESCKMNRQTFYYHFDDIYDLMEWLLKKEAVSIITQHQGPELWERGVKDLFDYLDANKIFARNAYKALGNAYLARFFYDDLYKLVHATIRALKGNIPMSKEETAFLAQYYVLSFATMIEGWLNDMIKQSPEELCAFLQQMIEDHMMGIAIRHRNLDKH